MADLSKYTKADLLWILKRLSLRCRHDIDVAINDLAYEKEKARLSEADRYRKVADAKRREYLDILAPYNGKPLLSIPISVLKRADRALKEAEAADGRWAKLMGLELNFGESSKVSGGSRR